jgi:hypothetical protein
LRRCRRPHHGGIDAGKEGGEISIAGNSAEQRQTRLPGTPHSLTIRYGTACTQNAATHRSFWDGYSCARSCSHFRTPP